MNYGALLKRLAGHIEVFKKFVAEPPEKRRVGKAVWNEWARDFEVALSVFAAHDGCTCNVIMAADPTRHFRGCPMREKYPTHVAEKIVEELNLDVARERNELLTRVQIYKAALVKIVGLKDVSDDFDDAWAVANEALSPQTFEKAEGEEWLKPLKVGRSVKLSAAMETMERDAKSYIGQNANLEVRNVREAVMVLLDAAANTETWRADDRTLIAALEKTVKILDERTAYQSKCDANNADAIQQLEKRLAALEAIDENAATMLAGLKEAIDQKQIEIPAWLKMTANVEQLTDRITALESASKRVDMSYSKAELEPDPMLRDAVRWPHGVPHAGPVDPDIIRKTSEHSTPLSPEALRRLVREAIPFQHDRPTIVCLCGSTKFAKAFNDANLEETLAGKIVLSVGSMTHSDDELSHCTVCGKVGKRETLMGDTCHGRQLKDGEGGVRSIEPHRIERSLTPEVKTMLDNLHKRKIEMADEVFVLNVIACKYCKRARSEHMTAPGGWACGQSSSPVPDDEMQPYIGESTRSEIEHALKMKKHLRFLNPQGRARTTALLYSPGKYEPTVEEQMELLGLAAPRKMFEGEISNVVGTAAKPRRVDVRRDATPVGCATCLHQCMEPDTDFYCSAVNKPWGQVLTRPRHKDCAGESGDQYLLWEKDTRGHRGGG